MAKARQQYFADEVTLQKENRDFAIQPELVEKLESIEAGAQVNVIETVKVNGEALTPDENKAVDVSVPLVEDTLYSTDPDKALSANQGKVLYEYIQNLASRGRYLSNWNAVTGLPSTSPVDNPYQYRAGDYYVVSNVAAEGGTNYRPDGSSYSWGTASTTVETETVKVGDYYTYDGQHWLLLVNTEREIAVDSSLSTTSTNPVENRVVTNALNTKQNNITDLETIRSGAALGATALQPGDSLSELTGTSDDITQGTTNLFMTTAERSKLSNQSGVNTGDETQTTIKNKLGQASTSTDGYLTSTDWNTFNNKQGAISDLETIRSNASAGKNASDTIATYGDIVTHDVSEFATSAQGGLADTAIQPGDNVSELTNDAGYITDAYHDDTKQDKLIAGANIQIAADGKTISATDTIYVAGDFDIKDLADSTGLRAEWSGKQDELIAGNNIQIAADGKTISATDTTYTAGVNVSISNNNVISATDNKAEWGNISGALTDQVDLNTVLGGKQDTLIAGTNVQIASDGKTISATDTTYTAGTGISIDANNVISNTQTSAEWGNITGTLSDQTDLQSALNDKQDELIAGANIQIASDGKTISATNTEYTAADFDIKDLADSTGKRTSWDAKQDAISDLATIRSNASTAIQPNDNVSELTNDAGYITSADIPTLDTAMSSTSTNGVQNKVIKSYVDTQVQEATAGAVSDTAYAASWDGITGIAPSKNAVYDKISAMDTTIAGKQDTISDLSTIRTGAGEGATAVQPGDNVSTLTNDAGFITNAVNDLTNYYTKSETYTKAEVADYVANFAGFKVVAQLPTTDIKTTIIYLLGPLGTGADKYEEYIYSNNAWVKIGETSVDLTNYFNTSTDNSDNITEGSTNLFLTSTERTKLSNTSGTNTGDETKATIQSKLGAATSSNDGYLTSADWSTFNGKANDADANTKTFFWVGTPSTAEGLEVWNWVSSGKNAVIAYRTQAGELVTEYMMTQYAQRSGSFYGFATFESVGTPGTTLDYGGTYSKSSRGYINIAENGTVTMTTLGGNINYLATDVDYSTVYTPTYDGSPATKKYVDDNIASATAGAVSDDSYSSAWDGVTGIAPSKNVVYDKINSMDTTIAGKQDTLTAGDNISINGTTISADVNTKTFELTGTTDTTNALKVVNWYKAGNTPIIKLNNSGLIDMYYLKEVSIIGEISGNRYMMDFYSKTIVGNRVEKLEIYTNVGATAITSIETSTSALYNAGTGIGINNNTITNTGVLSVNGQTGDVTIDMSNYLAKDNTTSFTPTGDYNPATKKYVDDSVSGKANASDITVKAYVTNGTMDAQTFMAMMNGLVQNGIAPIIIYDLEQYYYERAASSSTAITFYFYAPSNGVSSGTLYNKRLTVSMTIQTAEVTITQSNENLALGSGDMSYSDFGWQAKTGATITLDLASTYTPSANFTVNAPSTIKDGQTYILRVNNGATAYTMTLGTNVTNPFDTDITLTANGVDQFVFLAIGGALELQPEGGGGGIAPAANSPINVKYIWAGTEAQYEALSSYDDNTVYLTV